MEWRIKNLAASLPITSFLNYSPPNVTTLPYLMTLDLPRTMNAHLDMNVCCNDSFLKEQKIFCGAHVLPQTDPDRESKKYGMIVGNLLKGLQTPHESRDAPSSKRLSEPSVTCGFDGCIYEHNSVRQPQNPSNFPRVPAGNSTPSHDWALLKAKIPRPNIAVSPFI